MLVQYPVLRRLTKRAADLAVRAASQTEFRRGLSSRFVSWSPRQTANGSCGLQQHVLHVKT